jgi:hypothetical protein
MQPNQPSAQRTAALLLAIMLLDEAAASVRLLWKRAVRRIVRGVIALDRRIPQEPPAPVTDCLQRVPAMAGRIRAAVVTGGLGCQIRLPKGLSAFRLDGLPFPFKASSLSTD